LSAAGGIVYLLMDCISRYGTSHGNGKRPFHMSSSANGMSLLFSFLLVQAGICIGALVEQTSFWVSYFQEQVIDNLKNDNGGIDKVESYANEQILRLAAIVAFGTALLILLDAMVYRCCCGCQHQDDKNKEDDHATTKNDQTDLKLEEMEAAEKGGSATSTSTSAMGDSPVANATPAWSSAS
jgi:hypothetical protein